MIKDIDTSKYSMVEVSLVNEVRSIITPYNTSSSGCEMVLVISEDDLRGCVFFVYKPNIIYKHKTILCDKRDLIAQILGVDVELKQDVGFGYGKTYKGGYPLVEYADNMAKQLHKRS